MSTDTRADDKLDPPVGCFGEDGSEVTQTATRHLGWPSTSAHQDVQYILSWRDLAIYLISLYLPPGHFAASSLAIV
jgi:hypothetical protein